MARSPRRAGSSVGTCSAASLLLLLLLLVPICCSSTTTTAESPLTRKEHLPPLYEPGAPGGMALRTGDTHPSFGKVDIFIDLACPKSAAAWPTLQHIVKDQRDRLNFAFHILPLSRYPIGHFAAKVVQVILAYSDGTFDDIEPFADLIFRNQRMVLYEEEYDMTLDAREIVSDWAIATSPLSAETFHRGMREPVFDDIILANLDSPFVRAVSDTPTVLLNGIFMMHLRGEQELRDLKAFIADPSFGSDDDALDGSTYGDDDDDMSPMWKLTELEIRGDYENLERRMRREQQLKVMQKKFEQMQLEQQQQEQKREHQQQQLDEQKQQQLEQQALLKQHTMRLRGAGVNALSSSTGYGLGTPRSHHESGQNSDSTDPCISFSSWEDPLDSSYPSSSRSWSLTTFSSFVRDFFSSTTGEEGGEEEQGDTEGSAGAGESAEAPGPAAAWIAKRQRHKQQQQQQQQQQRETTTAAATGEAKHDQLKLLLQGLRAVWSRWYFSCSLFDSFEEFGALVAVEH